MPCLAVEPRRLLVAAILVAVPGLAGAQQLVVPVDSAARAVDHVFDAWRGTDRPGCAVGVSRGGHVLYEQGYGMANLETGTPITPASIFHVASVSKQFTAMAIMLLVRDGKLSVDDNIRKYLPEIPDYGTPITIRHLLTHTSGLRDQWELLSLARGRFEEDRITEADVMDIVPRQTALNFAPGAEYVYSNTGFTLLGVIVRRVSGKTLRTFADERIFKPLGMLHTHFHDDYTMIVPGRTSAYEPKAGGWRVGIPNFDVYGATNLYTTVGDLLTWEANLDHPIVGDAALIARMEQPTVLTTGDTSRYGFGLALGTYRGARLVEHNGADAGYRSYVGRFPDQGLAVAIACNAATANTTALARGVADAYLGRTLASAPNEVMPQAVPLTAGALERRVGVYVQPTTLQVFEIGMRDGHLVLGPGPAGGTVLVPVADDRYRVTGRPGPGIRFAAGDHAGFEWPSLNGGTPAPYEWRQSVKPGPAALAAYAGEYVSAEFGGAVYTVGSTDSTLTFRTGTSEPFSASPVFADTFLGDGYTIQFQRSRGDITGYEMTNGRVRHVRFVKRNH